MDLSNEVGFLSHDSTMTAFESEEVAAAEAKVCVKAAPEPLRAPLGPEQLVLRSIVVRSASFPAQRIGTDASAAHERLEQLKKYNVSKRKKPTQGTEVATEVVCVSRKDPRHLIGGGGCAVWLTLALLVLGDVWAFE